MGSMGHGCWIFLMVTASIYLQCQAHYCYYCGTSSTDTMTRSVIANQRVFTYPFDTQQKHCYLPYLMETGVAQLCDTPLCVTVVPSTQMEDISNFVVLGCAEMVLRPSMLSRIPLDAYTNTANQPVCIDFEQNVMNRKSKFAACFCNTNWCNTGEQTGTSQLPFDRITEVVDYKWIKNDTSTVSVTSKPVFTETVPVFDGNVEGSGVEHSEDGDIGEQDTRTRSTARPLPTKPWLWPDWNRRNEVATKLTTMTPGNVRDHKLLLNGDEEWLKTRVDKSARPNQVEVYQHEQQQQQRLENTNSASIKWKPKHWFSLLCSFLGLVVGKSIRIDELF